MRTAKWFISFLTPGIAVLSTSVASTLPSDRDWPKLLLTAIYASFAGIAAMGANKAIDKKVKK